MAPPLTSLFDALRQIDDPRQARGVRHPYTSLLALTFLGLLCRQTDLAGLQRWAKDHWQTLRGPLGFTRTKPPHATTISRAAATFSLGQFRDTFARWVTSLPRAPEAVTVAVAVDGKTSKQGHDPDGDPVHMLNVFAHELNLCLAQFPVTGGKPTAPQALKHALKELLENDPFLRLFTADALFTQRPLARVILDAERDSLFAVKDHPLDLREAILTSLGDVAGREPDAKSVEKNGASGTPGGSGWSKATRSPTPARRPGSPASGLILRIDTEVTKAGAPVRQEARSLITSLGSDELSPKRLMDLVRGHWGVENGLHFLKDRWWDEDRQWSIRPGLAERLAMPRDTSLAALRLIPGLPEGLPIRARADHLSRRLRKALKFFGALELGLCNPPGRLTQELAAMRSSRYNELSVGAGSPSREEPSLMTIEQLRNLYDARPFRPFVINWADGRQVPVQHREFIMSVPSGRTVVVAQPDDTLNIIDLLLVTDLEIKPSASPSGQPATA